MTCIELNILTWILKETSIIVGVKQEKIQSHARTCSQNSSCTNWGGSSIRVADTLFSLAGIMSVSVEKKWFMWRNLLDIKLELWWATQACAEEPDLVWSMIHPFHSSPEKGAAELIITLPFPSPFLWLHCCLCTFQIPVRDFGCYHHGKIIAEYGEVKGPITPPSAPSGEKPGRKPSASHHAEWFLEQEKYRRELHRTEVYQSWVKIMLWFKPSVSLYSLCLKYRQLMLSFLQSSCPEFEA